MGLLNSKTIIECDNSTQCLITINLCNRQLDRHKMFDDTLNTNGGQLYRSCYRTLPTDPILRVMLTTAAYQWARGYISDPELNRKGNLILIFVKRPLQKIYYMYVYESEYYRSS